MLAIKEVMDENLRALLKKRAQEILDEQVAASQQQTPRASQPQTSDQLSQIYRGVLLQGSHAQQTNQTGSEMQIGLDAGPFRPLLARQPPLAAPSIGNLYPSRGVLLPRTPPHPDRGTATNFGPLSAAASLASSSCTSLTGASLPGVEDARVRDVARDLLSRMPITHQHQHARTSSMLSPAALLLIERAATQQRLRQQEQVAFATAAASATDVLAGRGDIRSALSLGHNLTPIGSLAQVIGLEGAKRLLSCANPNASLRTPADTVGSGSALAEGLTAELIAAKNANLLGASGSLSQTGLTRAPVSSGLVEGSTSRGDAGSAVNARNVPLDGADGAVPQKVKSNHQEFGDTGPTKKKKKRRRRPRLPRSKKPKDMPKRPLSAYNIFFRDERAKILNSIPDRVGKVDVDSESHSSLAEKPVDEGGDGESSSCPGPKKPHGKIGFENLAKVIGSRWKHAPKDTLEKYKVLAEIDMRRYKAEMKEYHAKEEEKQKIALEEAAEKKKAGKPPTGGGGSSQLDEGDPDYNSEEGDADDDEEDDSEDGGETVETKDETVQSDDTSFDPTTVQGSNDDCRRVIPPKKRRRLNTYDEKSSVEESDKSSFQRFSDDSKSSASQADVIKSL